MCQTYDSIDHDNGQLMMVFPGVCVFVLSLDPSLRLTNYTANQLRHTNKLPYPNESWPFNDSISRCSY